MYEGHLESKERFAIKKYLLIIGKKKNCRFYHTPSPTSPHSHLGHYCIIRAYYAVINVTSAHRRHIANRKLVLIRILPLSHSFFFFRFYFYQYMFVFLFNTVINVFLLLRLCVLIVRLPWLGFFRAYSSVVRQMPGYNKPRPGTACTLPKFLCCSMYCLFCVVLCTVCV
jgi:hypothetical protein